MASEHKPNESTGLDGSGPSAATTSGADWSAEEYQGRTGLVLLPQHHQQLIASGLSLAVAARRGYFSVTTKTAIGGLGFAPAQQRPPALVVPVHSVSGDEVALHQIRPDDPRCSDDGKAIKYETPKRAGLRLDVHPSMRTYLGDPERPLFITEGAKKVDAATSAGYCCIGLMGVTGWRGSNADGGITALADWEHIALKGRRVHLAFDSDVMTKLPVYQALTRIYKFLQSKGADLYVIYLPSDTGGGKVGIDDYLAPWSILGIRPTATAEVAKAAQRKLAFKHHPDRGGSEWLMKVVNHAYETVVERIDAGHGDLTALATQELRRPDSTRGGDQGWMVGDYVMDAERGTFRMSGMFSAPRQIANFAAGIERKSFEDDGDLTSERNGLEDLDAIRLAIRAQQGKRTELIEVTQAEFIAMSWPARARKLDLVVASGSRDQMREAIERVSIEWARERDGSPLVPRHSIYVHTGWRKLDGHGWAWLHRSGAIGAAGLIEDVSVRLPVELGHDLPPPTEGEQLRRAVRASLALIDLGADGLMVPVLGAVYRSVLAECDFALHIHGASNQFKTQVALLGLAHQARCDNARDLRTISWTSTDNSMEGLLFQAKEAVAVLDDFLPAGLPSRERDQMMARAARIFRAQGNSAGRSRMRADSSIRPTKLPRGIVYSTGEEVPRGLSLVARIWIIEQKRGEVTSEELTRAQTQAPLYSLAMSSYIRSLAPQIEDVRKGLRSARDEVRRAYPAQHGRTSEIAAHLELGWRYFLNFAIDCGAVSSEESEALIVRVRTALITGCRNQEHYQGEGDPIEKYRSGLTAALTAGEAYLAGPLGFAPNDPSSWGWRSKGLDDEGRPSYWEPANPRDRIGWIDGGDLYLVPEAAYRAAAAQHESGLGIGEDALRRRLRDGGHLASIDGRHILPKAPRALDPSRPRVLHLNQSFLVGPVGPVGPDAPSDRGSSSSGPTSDPTSGPTSGETVGPSGAKKWGQPSSNGGAGPTGPTGPTHSGKGEKDSNDPLPEPPPDLVDVDDEGPV